MPTTRPGLRSVVCSWLLLLYFVFWSLSLFISVSMFLSCCSVILHHQHSLSRQCNSQFRCSRILFPIRVSRALIFIRTLFFFISLLYCAQHRFSGPYVQSLYCTITTRKVLQDILLIFYFNFKFILFLNTRTFALPLKPWLSDILYILLFYYSLRRSRTQALTLTHTHTRSVGRS